VRSMEKGHKLIHAEKKFSLWLLAATAIHALVISLAIYLQVLDSRRQLKPKIVSVSLISLPGSGGSHEFSEKQGGAESLPAPSHATPNPPVAKKRIMVKEAVPQPAAVTPKKVKKPVKVKEPVPKVEPVTPKKVSVEPLKPKVKPKVIEKQPDISKAIERLKQNVDKKAATSSQPPANSINNALAQLQQKVKSESGPAGAGSGGGRGNAPAGRGGAGKGYGGGGTSAPYKAEIASIIMQNWEFSKLLLKSSYGMEVYVRINILANGTINQIVFDKKAPSEYLNNSVKKALEKSSPLPLLPKEEGTRDVWIGFVFTPEGIEK